MSLSPSCFTTSVRYDVRVVGVALLSLGKEDETAYIGSFCAVRLPLVYHYPSSTIMAFFLSKKGEEGRQKRSFWFSGKKFSEHLLENTPTAPVPTCSPQVLIHTIDNGGFEAGKRENTKCKKIWPGMDGDQKRRVGGGKTGTYRIFGTCKCRQNGRNELYIGFSSLTASFAPFSML